MPDGGKDAFLPEQRGSNRAGPVRGPDSMVGTSRLSREIGRGGMSIVYEGYQEPLGRRVAVKALELVGPQSEEMAERFRREGRAYAAIHHASIISVYDLIEEGPATYLVVEYVDGADLERVLAAGGAIPPECVAAVGARLADALACVHEHHLVHRDVKPANLMISRDGDVKLMDFGIAKNHLATEITRIGMVVGSPHYLAPEVLAGDPEDGRSDIWSVGVTLYQLATGERPFSGGAYRELFAAVRKGRLQPVRRAVPGYPRRLARIIERCMERDPDRRWPSAAVLAAELQACARDLLRGTAPATRLARLMVERGVAGPDPVTLELTPADILPPIDRDRARAAGDVLFRLALAVSALALVAALTWAWWAVLLPWQ